MARGARDLRGIVPNRHRTAAFGLPRVLLDEHRA